MRKTRRFTYLEAVRHPIGLPEVCGLLVPVLAGVSLNVADDYHIPIPFVTWAIIWALVTTLFYHVMFAHKE